MNQIDLELYLNTLLEAGRFQDYCPNGLQVQGRTEIRRLATGVTASLAFLEAAVEWGADAVLVHHGYFWKGEDARVIGQKRRRLQLLLAHDLNLFAYHLPLDAHPELGNNAQLARQLGWVAEGRFGPGDIGWHGRLAEPAPLAQVAAAVSGVLQREPLLLGDPGRSVRRLAWCTGGAQGYFDAAIALGVDLYVSGEASEQTTHLARESGVAYLGAGHHATERYGVQALGQHLASVHGLEHRFIEIPNPV